MKKYNGCKEELSLHDMKFIMEHMIWPVNDTQRFREMLHTILVLQEGVNSEIVIAVKLSF